MYFSIFRFTDSCYPFGIVTLFLIIRYQEEFEDTKEVIRIHKWKKDRQHNGQTKRNKRTNNDLQNIHIKLKIELHEPH